MQRARRVGGAAALACCMLVAVSWWSMRRGGDVSLLAHDMKSASKISSRRSRGELNSFFQSLHSSVSSAPIDDGLSHAARATESELSKSIDQLASLAHSSTTSKDLAAEMKNALNAVRDLRSQLDRKGSREKRSWANHRHTIKHAAQFPSSAANAIQKKLAQVRIKSDDKDLDVFDLKGDDDKQAREELSKMIVTARRLTKEVSAIAEGSRVPGIKSSVLGVLRSAKAVEEAKGKESDARDKIVAHELAVRRKKLMEAEAEEKAAARAAKEAFEAEKIAQEKHSEASKDLELAEERRKAARRARAIIAEGNIKREKSDRKVEEPASRTQAKQVRHAKTREHPASDDVILNDNDTGYEDSKTAVARQCTDTIAKYGCSSLLKDSPCLSFCRGAEHGASLRNSYVDDVYGTPYDPSTYEHDRHGFFARKDGEQSGDILSNGHDYRRVVRSEGMNSLSRVLAGEKRMQQKLQSSLEQEQAENIALRKQVKDQESSLRSLSKSLSYRSGYVPQDGRTPPGQSIRDLPDTPPLPEYKQVGRQQELAEVFSRAKGGGLILHNAEFINKNKDLHDPMRPM